MPRQATGEAPVTIVRALLVAVPAGVVAVLAVGALGKLLAPSADLGSLSVVVGWVVLALTWATLTWRWQEPRTPR
jgi:hypothetical protein